MASIRKARGKWLAEVRIKGYYQSKTFFSKIEAQSWAVEIERQRNLVSIISDNSIYPPIKDIPLDQIEIAGKTVWEVRAIS